MLIFFPVYTLFVNLINVWYVRLPTYERLAITFNILDKTDR